MMQNKENAAHPACEADNQLNIRIQNEILDFLKQVKFKRKLFGGVDEADVWKKIEKLNSLYERAVLLNSAEKTGSPDA